MDLINEEVLLTAKARQEDEGLEEDDDETDPETIADDDAENDLDGESFWQEE